MTVRVTNRGDLDATVHWHGLRLENRYDGTHDTQAPIPVGETLHLPRCTSPTPARTGTTRTSARTTARSSACTGTSSSSPAEPDYWPPANRELLLTLDDVLIEDGRIAAVQRAETTHVAMGRFGNVMLVAGEPELTLDGEARRGRAPLPHEHGEHARLQRRAGRRAHEARRRRQRPLRARGARRGGAARAVGARRRRRPLRGARRGAARAPHPERTYRLAAIAVGDEPAEPDARRAVHVLRTNADLAAERERIAPLPRRAPGQDARLRRGDGPRRRRRSGGTYVCPMHPEVVSDEPGKCPKCGMKLVAAHLVAEGDHGHGARRARARPPRPGERTSTRRTPRAGRRASSGRTTWSRSTG